jgi:acyl transferase domain-containing protein/thioesterase domain-containing protein
MSNDQSALPPNAIAVVGTAGRFPGARSVRELWGMLREGREAVSRFGDAELLAAGVDPAALADPSYVKAGLVLPDMERFDAGFFGFSPREAAILDPQHRHFLMAAWEALEDAGHTPAGFEGRIGVFAGSGLHAYFAYNLLNNAELMRTVGLFLVRHTGNDKDFLATRLSYLLDLRGPSVNVQTACSTSLVAIHLAAQSLLSGECDMALAGGVSIELPHRQGYFAREGEILSPDGHCRAFDAKSAGTLFGSGAGVVVLRRLEDALKDGDDVRAVVLGSAVNNDGARKVGYLAPSVDGQAQAMAEALAVAGVEPDSVSYVEAHGTGTPMGDPIEVAALNQVYGGPSAARGSVGLGSIKTNIGHLDTAAGVASFIKAVESLRHRQLAPTLHYAAPNPAIDFAGGPFAVVDTARPWEGASPRRAAVNSLGVGGTNAHVVLEEAPARAAPTRPAPYELLVLSAKTASALERGTDRWADFLGTEEGASLSLADAGYTLREGRQAFAHRRVVVAADAADARAALASRDAQRVFTARAEGHKAPEVVFLFPGGGAQHPGMLRALYGAEPRYRAEVDRCLALLPAALAATLKKHLFCAPGEEAAAAEALERPSLSLPATFIVSVALARYWMALGVKPAAMTGHSLGEYAAAHLAGVMSLPEALSLVCLRGELFEQLPAGGMLSVNLPEAELRALLGAGGPGEGLSLACVNGPELCVASGALDALARLEAGLKERGVECRRVRIHVAAHSHMLEPILEAFRAKVATFQLKAPQLPYVSNLTGTWAKAEEVTRPDFWVRHLRETVLFAQGLAVVAEGGGRVLLEVGPGQTLSGLARGSAEKAPARAVLSSAPHPQDKASDLRHVLTTAGRLWSNGVQVDWKALRAGQPRRRVSLPTYAFDLERHWVEADARVAAAPAASTSAAAPAGLVREPEAGRWFWQWRWSEVDAPRVEASRGEGPQRWWVLAEEGEPVAAALLARLRAAGHAVVTVRPGASCARVGEGAWQVDAGSPESVRALVAGLLAEGGAPTRVAHLWLLGAADAEARRALGVPALVWLAQALANEDVAGPLHLLTATDRAQPVDGAPLRPFDAGVLGPARVIPRELPQVAVSCAVDVDVREGADVVAGRLLAEAEASGEAAVAWRGGKRWAQGAVRAELPELPAGASGAAVPAGLREGGVYLVTGGLGGIGLTVAEALARHARARVALVGRQGLPPREEWDALLARAPESDAAVRVRGVRAVEAAGGEVRVVRADVTDRAAMAAALEGLRGAWGAVHGVVHAAGLLDDGPLQLRTPEALGRVLGAKVEGARVLDALLPPGSLDFFLVFSSTSALLGAAGQADYAAANLVLEALAASRPDGRALAWGVWSEVGMAAAAARPPALAPLTGPSAGYPLLDVVVEQGPGRVELAADYTVAGRWLLSEHRLAQGPAFVPGAGFLELAREALSRTPGEGAVELRRASFVAPLGVADGASRRVRVVCEAGADGTWSFAVESRGADEAEWTLHAQGAGGRGAAARPPRADVAALARACAERSVRYAPGVLETRQAKVVAFGPRWRNLRALHLGRAQALAELELDAAFAADLPGLGAHPALLDLGTSFPLPLVPEAEQDGVFFVPVSAEAVRFHAPLPARVLSHAKRRSGVGPGLASFDLQLLAPTGEVLVEVDGFTLRQVDPRAVQAGAEAPHASPARPGGRRTPLDALLEAGIRPAEGARALVRVLASGRRQVAVSSIDLTALRARLAPLHPRAAAEAAPGAGGGAPEGAGKALPRTDVERRVAAVWEELLGVKPVGLDDDFFALGGHSLVAVRLFARLRKTFGVDLTLATLFQAPTLGQCAALVAEEAGLPNTPEVAPAVQAAGGAAPREAPAGGAAAGGAPAGGPAQAPAPAAPAAPRRGAWSPLVLIQKGREGRLPFFCVHGAGGNVLNFRTLALRLGADQPFYGLQAQGVDGKLPALNRVEDMAAVYLAAVREVQPRGPYLLGGYSGGGVVAYEMAQRLKAAGEEVRLVAMLDTFAPSVRPHTPGFGERLKRLVSERGGYLAQWPEKLRRRRNHAQQLQQIAAVEASGAPMPLELRELYLFTRYQEAQATYAPAPYEGRVVLFRARDISPIYAHAGPELGWTGLVRPGLEVHEVPGNHDSLVLEPNVDVLVAGLKGCLELARA